MREFIYGPFKSRRLGLSLGVNILKECKICTYNCVYCEIGSTPKDNLVSPESVIHKSPKGQFLRELNSMLKYTPNLDSITFGYNGETTLNPEIDSFLEIARNARDKRNWNNDERPNLTLFTNSSTLYLKKVRDKIMNFDVILAKLDTGNQEDFLRTNRPHKKVPHIDKIINSLVQFRKEKPPSTKLILQILFYNSYNENFQDNTTKHNINSLIKAIKKIQPQLVQIYSIARIPAEPFVYSIDNNKTKEITNDLKKNINNGLIEIKEY
jgi:wyosine [tRNA(Phe)-imidazoG37] synthetase (radical SAM superfamily)